MRIQTTVNLITKEGAKIQIPSSDNVGTLRANILKSSPLILVNALDPETGKASELFINIDSLILISITEQSEIITGGSKIVKLQ